ncbi:MAG TPA: hypothetical protein PLU72_08200 [Candidatus Ozemobacteraceae bacterium]|nr:hypothetical protein [Candidatus Ozemobacteraceae bacterium]HQG29959.1 hypothetical protein [Candidatus Ozemobacteraceae bacterium]
MSDIEQNSDANQLTTPEGHRGPSLGDQIEELENRFPWGIIGFLGAWAYLLLTYWL